MSGPWCSFPPLLLGSHLAELSRSLVKRFIVRALCCIFIQERSRERRVLFPRNPALEKRESGLSVVVVIYHYQFPPHLNKIVCCHVCGIHKISGSAEQLYFFWVIKYTINSLTGNPRPIYQRLFDSPLTQKLLRLHLCLLAVPGGPEADSPLLCKVTSI